MADFSLAELLLRVRSESGDAERDLAGLAGTLEGLGSIDPEADVTVKVKGVDKLLALHAALDDVKDVKIEPHISGSFMTNLKKINDELLQVGKAQVPGAQDISTRLQQAAAKAPQNVGKGAVLFDPKPIDDTIKKVRELESGLRGISGAVPIDPKKAAIGSRAIEDTTGKLKDLGQTLRDIGAAQPSSDLSAALDRTAKAARDAGRGEESLRSAIERTRQAAERPILHEQGPSGASAFNPKAVDTFRSALSNLGSDASTVEKRMDNLGKAIEGVNKRRGSGGGPLDDISRGISRLGGMLNNLKGAEGIFSNLGQAFGGMGGGIGSVTTNLGPFGARLGLVTGAIIVLVGVIAVSLVGALLALASSLAFAVAGLAAMGVAVAAAMGPLAVLAIPVMLSLTKIMKVLQAEQQNSVAAGQRKAQADRDARHAAEQHADAVRSLHDALRSQNDAEANLTSAVQDANKARVAAYQEWAAAVEDVKDKRLSLARAELSKDQATLGIKQAELELQKFRQQAGATGPALDSLFKKFTDVQSNFQSKALAKGLGQVGVSDPSDQLKFAQLVLNVRDARLREKEATDGVKDSQNDLTAARKKEAEFAKKGIKASDQYVAALDRVKGAHRGVEDAARRVADANRGLVRLQKDQADQLAASQTKVESLTGKLTTAEDDLLKKVKDVWGSLKGTFGPATQQIIGAFSGALDNVPAAVDRIKGAFTLMGVSVSDVIGGVAKKLTSKEVTDAFTTFATGGSQILQPIADIFGSVLTILGRIALEAMPYVVDAFSHIAQFFKDLTNGPFTIDGIRSALNKMVPNLQTWWDITKNLSGAFLGFLSAAAPDGKSLADSIAKGAKWLNDWIHSAPGRKNIKDFFDAVVPLAKAVAGFIFRLTVGFLALTIVAAPVLTTIFNGLNSILDKLKLIVPLWTALHKAAGFDFEKFLGDFATGKLFEGPANKAADALTKAFNNAFGIKSPSKVTEGLGKNVLDGFIKGLVDPKKVTDAVNLTFAIPVVGATPETIPKQLFSDLSKTAGTVGKVINNNITLPPAPKAAVPDARYQATQLANELARRGGG